MEFDWGSHFIVPLEMAKTFEGIIGYLRVSQLSESLKRLL